MRATWTGNRTNGIIDGIRNEWYAKFDLKSPASDRDMPYTCVVERPELQEIMMRRTSANIRTASGVESYRTDANGRVVAVLQDGEEIEQSEDEVEFPLEAGTEEFDEIVKTVVKGFVTGGPAGWGAK